MATTGRFVEDFYWYLLHSTAAHAFPEGIFYEWRVAWHDRFPHVTGAANYALMLRHMLIHEAGHELHLLTAVPDGWLGDGQQIRVERAPTHFGEMNLLVRGTKEGVEIKLDPPRREPPKKIIVHLPQSRPLVGALEGVKVVIAHRSATTLGFSRGRRSLPQAGQAVLTNGSSRVQRSPVFICSAFCKWGMASSCRPDAARAMPRFMCASAKLGLISKALL